MSSKKFEPPLHIELAPSKWLLISLLAIHLGAVLLTIFMEISTVIKLVLITLLLASLLVSLGKSGWVNTLPVPVPSWTLLRWQYVPLLTWQSDNDWHISTRNGQAVLAQLLPSSTCHGSFAALNFRTDQIRWWDRYISVVIFADAIDQEVFRQLRVRLRTRFVQERDN